MISPAPGMLRILLLEDSELDAELIRRELIRAGRPGEFLVVQTQETYETGLAEYSPELIFADYRLPAFDGAAALALARERCPEVPVLIVSGTVGEEAAVELL